jgi:hypothetical protein
MSDDEALDLLTSAAAHIQATGDLDLQTFKVSEAKLPFKRIVHQTEFSDGSLGASSVMSVL